MCKSSFPPKLFLKGHYGHILSSMPLEIVVIGLKTCNQARMFFPLFSNDSCAARPFSSADTTVFKSTMAPLHSISSALCLDRYGWIAKLDKILQNISSFVTSFALRLPYQRGVLGIQVQVVYSSSFYWMKSPRLKFFQSNPLLND